MTRFEMNLNGQFGEFWKNQAEKEIEQMANFAKNGDILVDENGGAYWKSSGRYLPEDCAEKLSYTGFSFSKDATNAAREEEDAKFFANYRTNWTAPSFEELAEIRANFGGETVIDIITGEIIA